MKEHIVFLLVLGIGSVSHSADHAVLQPSAVGHHVERFNAMEEETVVNAIDNREAGDWLQRNIPLFECPDEEVEEFSVARRRERRGVPAASLYGFSCRGHLLISVFQQRAFRRQPRRHEASM